MILPIKHMAYWELICQFVNFYDTVDYDYKVIINNKPAFKY